LTLYRKGLAPDLFRLAKLTSAWSPSAKTVAWMEIAGNPAVYRALDKAEFS